MFTDTVLETQAETLQLFKRGKVRDVRPGGVSLDRRH